MAFELEAKDDFNNEFKKASKRNSELRQAVKRKVEQILENPYHFKPLCAPMHGLRRVHILKSFVLIYSINEERKTVVLTNFLHHDEAYRM